MFKSSTDYFTHSLTCCTPLKKNLPQHKCVHFRIQLISLDCLQVLVMPDVANCSTRKMSSKRCICLHFSLEELPYPQLPEFIIRCR